MDVHTAIHQRRTVHHYLPEPVDDAIVERALSAAHMAPCHKHTWPWRFLRVGPRTRETLIDIGLDLKAARCGGTLPPERAEAVRTKMGNPAHLIVVTRVKTDDPFRAREDYAAVATAIQNFMLSAQADGVGTKWGSGGVTRDPRSYEALGVDPDTEQIEAFLWLGVPRIIPEIRRPSLDEVVRTLP